MFFRITLIILFAITIACSKEDPEYKLNPKVNAYEVYKEAYEAFEKQDYFFEIGLFSFFFLPFYSF